ncbi:MAG: DUF6716 putative glycosyltransferase, partial [Ilumatobacter sp.]
LGDSHDIVAELLRVWLRHSNILPGPPRGQARSDVTEPCSSPKACASHRIGGVSKACEPAVVSRCGEQMTKPESVSVLCVGDTDTRLKWTSTIAQSLIGSLPGSSVRYIAAGNAAPTPMQLASVGLHGPVVRVADREFAASLGDCEVIVVCMRMYRLHAVLEHVRSVQASGQRRPIVITGYAGVVYEGHEMGALWRAGADVVCCNSERDFRLFEDLYDELGLDPGVLVRSGVGVMAQDRMTIDSIIDRCRTLDEPTNVVFAVQPDVPRSRAERVVVLDALVAYAERWPERVVTIKLRSRPGETTTHPEAHHYQDLADTHLDVIPANLRFSYGLMSAVLEETDLLITVSSTAALEALSYGVPAAILTDFGVRANYGTPFFLRSGLLRSMAQLTDGDLPVPNAEWLEQNGFSVSDNPVAVVERLEELLEMTDLPAPPPRFMDEANTPFLVGQAMGWVGAEATCRSSMRHRLRRLLNGPLRRSYVRFDGWLRR